MSIFKWIWQLLTSSKNIQCPIGHHQPTINGNGNHVIQSESINIQFPSSLPHVEPPITTLNDLGNYITALADTSKGCSKALNEGQNRDVINQFNEFLFNPIKRYARDTLTISFDARWFPWHVEFRGINNNKGFDAEILYKGRSMSSDAIHSWETESLSLTDIFSRITFRNIDGNKEWTPEQVVAFFMSDIHP